MSRAMIIFVLLFSGIAGIAAAEPTAHARELIDQLGSDSWIERDMASADLMRLVEEIPLSDLEYFLSDMTLSIEARARLVEVCTYRFLDFPKAGLGVSFGVIKPGAIEITPIENNPNFPASAMLNPGDAIARVDGRMLINALDFQLEILSRMPGESISVTVLRAGRLLDMELPLGAFSDLSGGNRLDVLQSQRALELRWARKGISVQRPDSIGESIDVDDWKRAVFPLNAAKDVRSTSRRTMTALVVGVRQRIFSGMPNLPRRVLPWDSLARIDRQVRSAMMEITGIELEMDQAKGALLRKELDQLIAELDSIADPDRADHLRDRIAELERIIEELDTKRAEPPG